MPEFSLERLILSGILLAVLLLAGFGIRALTRTRRASRLATADLRTLADPATPTLVYFWTSDCAQCRPQEQQIARARETLRTSGRGLAVRKVDAHQAVDLVRTLGVMTVPTTVLVGSGGEVAGWNAGLTPAEEIVRQCSRVS